MIIEGKNPVKELLNSDTTIEKVYILKSADPQLNFIASRAKERRIKIIISDKATLDKLSVSKKHQGVLAITTEYKYVTVDDILAVSKAKGKDKLILVLDGVEDPHNLGALIRTAECAGVDGIIIGKHRAAGVTDAVIKVSAGAAAHVLIARVTNINDVLRRFKDEFIKIVAGDLDGVGIYDEKNSRILTGDIAIVIGGENEGVKALTKKFCDYIVALPMQGKVNSLNASVAGGVLLFETVRQRGEVPKGTMKNEK